MISCVSLGLIPASSAPQESREGEVPDQAPQQGLSDAFEHPPRTILQEPDPNAHFPSLGMIVQVLTAAEGSMCIHPVPPSYRYGEGTAAVSVPRGINDIFITSIYSGPQCRADQGAYAEKLAFQKQQGEKK
ncbi:MAG: hypothetical protein HYS80_02670 [Candidatus Aenigmarchaeota archaeon]|nr:hypothetical protein [Candidatus Aenigmarchaeota archaeon]